jgi:hypothetical protein
MGFAKRCTLEDLATIASPSGLRVSGALELRQGCHASVNDLKEAAEEKPPARVGPDAAGRVSLSLRY